MTTSFTESHEWVRVDGDVATVGITEYAQGQLGDVVYIELPKPGQELVRGKEAAIVESVKAASEIYAPATGTVTEANQALASDPALVNRDATGAGWFFKFRLINPTELTDLMDETAYKAMVAELP